VAAGKARVQHANVESSKGEGAIAFGTGPGVIVKDKGVPTVR